MNKAYEEPTIETLGTVSELTESTAKCTGSGDASYPGFEIGRSCDNEPL
jgi:hypothetical protein